MLKLYPDNSSYSSYHAFDAFVMLYCYSHVVIVVVVVVVVADRHS